MSSEPRRGDLPLDRRIRTILRTVCRRNPDPTIEELLVSDVKKALGSETVTWHSHQLLDTLHCVASGRGERQIAAAIDDLICWPEVNDVDHESLVWMSDRIAQLGDPQIFETAVASSFLTPHWPVRDGLIPSSPFRILERRITVESLSGREVALRHIGNRVATELPWVVGRLVVAGALDDISELPFQEACRRWDLLQARIEGVLQMLPRPPEVVWEVPGQPVPLEGQLFVDPDLQERHQGFILRGCEETPVTAGRLGIQVPLPIPMASRKVLSRGFRSPNPPEIHWQESAQLALLGGRLHSDPLGLTAILQRTQAFDQMVRSMVEIPWGKDWLHAEKSSLPLWIASENSNPHRAIEVLRRNSIDPLRIPVIGIESCETEKARRDAKKLILKISRRRGGGWERLEELLRAAAISPRLLASTSDRP